MKSTIQQSTSFQSIWGLPIGLATQLLLSHLIAAVIAIEINQWGQPLTPLVAPVVVGLVLTFTIWRSSYLINIALKKINAGTPTPISRYGHGPLNYLVTQVNTLIKREQDVQTLRQNLLHQATMSAAQQERNRLARELHDSIKQQIFSISMSAAAIQARWESDPKGAKEALSHLRRNTKEVMVEMNALLQQLSPAPLEKVGLQQALRDQCQSLGYRTEADVQVTFGPLPDDDWLPSGSQESLFRIAQEALSNIARHARANKVSLYLGQRNPTGPLILEIEDNGQGFEADTTNNGMGLDNIRQRTQTLNGQLSLNSTPEQGTTLQITLPLVAPATPIEATLKEQNHKPEHTFNKIFLTGLGGGLALIALLIYPLYILLPGNYVDNWSTGSNGWGLLLQLSATLLPVITGYLAVRWAKANTRQYGTLFGALAGGVAGAIFYFGLGAVAASLSGSAQLVKYGLIPAVDDAHMVGLLADSFIGIVWWLHSLFWLVLLIGIGLGAIGGLLSPLATTPKKHLQGEMKLLLAIMTLMSTVAFCIAFIIFFSMEPTIQQSVINNSAILETTLPLNGLSFGLIGTSMLFYLLSSFGLYLFLRFEIKSAPVNAPASSVGTRLTAAIFSFISFCVPIYLAMVKGSLTIEAFHSNIIGITVAVSSLILGILYISISTQNQYPGWTLFYLVPFSLLLLFGGQVGILLAFCLNLGLLIILGRRTSGTFFTTSAPTQLRLMMVYLMSAGLGGVVVMLMPLIPIISVIVNIIRIPIIFIATLLTYDESNALIIDYNLIDVIQNTYLTQATVSIISFVVCVAIVGLLILINSGMIAIVTKHTTIK